MTSLVSAAPVQARVITVFGNDIVDGIGHKVVLTKRTAPNYDKVLDLVSKLIPLAGGVRKLYTLPDCKLVRTLEQLQQSSHSEFIAVGLKSLNRQRLPRLATAGVTAIPVGGGKQGKVARSQRHRPLGGPVRKPGGVSKLSPLGVGKHGGSVFPRRQPVGKLTAKPGRMAIGAPPEDIPVQSDGHAARGRPESAEGGSGELGDITSPSRGVGNVDRASRVLVQADEVNKVKASERDRQRRAHLERMMLRQRVRQSNQAERVNSVADAAGAVDNRIDRERERQAALLREKIEKRNTQLALTVATGSSGSNTNMHDSLEDPQARGKMSAEVAAATIQAAWKAHKFRSKHHNNQARVGQQLQQQQQQRPSTDAGDVRPKPKHAKRRSDGAGKREGRRRHRANRPRGRSRSPKNVNNTSGNAPDFESKTSVGRGSVAANHPVYGSLLKQERVPTPDLRYTEEDLDLLRNSAAITIQKNVRGYLSRKKHGTVVKRRHVPDDPMQEPCTAVSTGADVDAVGEVLDSDVGDTTEATKNGKSKHNVRKRRSKNTKSPTSVSDLRREESRFSLRGIEDKHVVDVRYEVGKAIGEGNFAVVKTCIDRSTGEKLALKIIDKSKTKGAKETRMIENEVRTMRKIHHPNCVRLYDVIDTEKELFLVMELIQGGDLFDRIISKGKYPEREAARVVRCMAKALNYMHSRGYIHRDLKPENLLVVTDDQGGDWVKLADFGLSMKVRDKLYTICGTPTYVAPEIISEPCNGYDLAVDMWATGVIAYIILCGFPPFASQQANPQAKQRDLFRRIRSGNFSFPYSHWKDITDEAKDLIRNLLKVNPSERFTAAQVLEHPWVANCDEVSEDTINLSDTISGGDGHNIAARPLTPAMVR